MSELQAFKQANARCGVVSGHAIGRGGEGATYVLSNGKVFTLTADECRQVTPRWVGIASMKEKTDG